MIAERSDVSISLSINLDKVLTVLCVRYDVLLQKKACKTLLGRDKALHWAGLAVEEKQHLSSSSIQKQEINIIRLIKFPRWGLKGIM